MHRYLNVFAATAVALTCGTRVFAQDQSTAARIAEVQKAAAAAAEADARRHAASIVPLKVTVVISKYQGEKKIGSMPYTLSVNANDGNGARLRVGAQVPFPIGVTPVIDGKTIPYGGPVQYKEIGTNIDCDATTLADGRFQLVLTIEDSSAYAEESKQDPRTISPPAIRSFRLNNTAILRDGQSTQFSTATDKLSGEVTKIDVMVNVVK